MDLSCVSNSAERQANTRVGLPLGAVSKAYCPNLSGEYFPFPYVRDTLTP
jgi:hypothetical protein